MPAFAGAIGRAGLALAFAAVFGSGCRRAPKGFGGVSLPQLDGAKTVSLASCPTPQCLAVYVAPWCPYCRASMPMVLQLRQVLRQGGMESWVIVGLDREPAVREYAREYGGDTLLDLAHTIEPGGVPHFYVLDGRGRILRQIAGLPPDPRQLVTWIAQAAPQ